MQFELTKDTLPTGPISLSLKELLSSADGTESESAVAGRANGVFFATGSSGCSFFVALISLCEVYCDASRGFLRMSLRMTRRSMESSRKKITPVGLKKIVLLTCL
jgi:hypothetical protein